VKELLLCVACGVEAFGCLVNLQPFFRVSIESASLANDFLLVMCFPPVLNMGALFLCSQRKHHELFIAMGGLGVLKVRS
jgi:hypothetical protein